MTWLLVIILFNHDFGTASGTYETRLLCEDMKEQILIIGNQMNIPTQAYCVRLDSEVKIPS